MNIQKLTEDYIRQTAILEFASFLLKRGELSPESKLFIHEQAWKFKDKIKDVE